MSNTPSIPSTKALDSQDEWITVSYNKKQKKIERKKKKEDSNKSFINKEIITFLNSLENRTDFVYLLLNTFIIKDCRCKELLDCELSKYGKSIKNLKRAKTIKDLNLNKSSINKSIKDMNAILNKDNIYILIGKEFITDKNGVQLKCLPDFKEEVIKYDEYIKKALNNTETHKEDNLHEKKDIESINIIREGISYASLFK